VKKTDGSGAEIVDSAAAKVDIWSAHNHVTQLIASGGHLLKSLLLLVLLVSLPIFQQVEREQPDLEVVKFSWAKEKQPSSPMIKGTPGGPVTNSVSGGQDLGSRKAGLRTSEKKAKSQDEKPADNYQLRLEVKNTGANVVKGLIWHFQPTAGPEDYQPKRYLCALQVKPKEKSLLEIWTPYLPVKVIKADERKDGLKDGTVVINQIEYADGSVWKKSGWEYKVAPDAFKKLAEGTCSVF
jgi:hypothetical protein